MLEAPRSGRELACSVNERGPSACHVGYIRSPKQPRHIFPATREPFVGFPLNSKVVPE